MRRILTFALFAAFALAATVPVSIVTAGKAAAGGKAADYHVAARRGR
jgi:hypothetical protein